MLLLDTNILSYLYKADSRISPYAPDLNGHRLAISLMTVAEMLQWSVIYKWGPTRVRRLEGWLETNFIVFPIDRDLCDYWANTKATCRAKGRPIDGQNAWIAATALQHQLPLVTHNPKDFSAVDELQLISHVSS
ncbi:PIN domain-containing protein [Anaerolineales bacterium HSG25]|nr:PIN domain-containing protein [Anaerolineales bacterium HSG25]